MLTWLHPYAVTDELLSRTDEKLDCLHVSNIANGNLNSMCQKNLENKNATIIATFYVSMACQQGFCIKLWPMGKGWGCEAVISLIYQAGHLMTDNFNFSVKLADWLLKHPSPLTGMLVSGYLLLEPSTVVLLLRSSSFQAAEREVWPKSQLCWRSGAVLAAHGHTVSASVERSLCSRENRSAGGLCAQDFEVGVGAKIKRILFFMEWICGLGVQILDWNPFCFLHRQR